MRSSLTTSLAALGGFMIVISLLHCDATYLTVYHVLFFIDVHPNPYSSTSYSQQHPLWAHTPITLFVPSHIVHFWITNFLYSFSQVYRRPLQDRPALRFTCFINLDFACKTYNPVTCGISSYPSINKHVFSYTE